MLNNSDIDILRKVIREEVRPIVKEEVRREVKQELQIQLNPINERLDMLERAVRSIKRRLTRVVRDISYMVKTYDEDIKNLRIRVDGLEKPPLKN